MFGLFKKDPAQKLQKEYDKKLFEAMQAQRNGDIKSYSMLSQEAEAILKQIDEINAKNGSSS